MARPSAWCSPRRNPPAIGEDESIGSILTKGTDTYTPAPAVSRASTPAPAPTSAPPLAPAPVDANAMVMYSEADLQLIFRTVLEARPLAPAPAPQPLYFPDDPCERPLKARFPELYCGKTHMECYNFIQQCWDHFATTGAKEPNRMPFAATFLWEQALFYWQQQKAKNAGETDFPLTWEEFKAFLRWSLGESRAFVDSIWRTITLDSQYQQEKAMDWAAHLKYLQTVLKEFDPAVAPTEEVLICYFCNGLKPSIQAQTDEQSRDLDTWKEVIKNDIDAEAKAACQPQSLMKEIDNCCFWGHRPTKINELAKKPKDTNKNNSRPQKSKAQALQRFKNADTSKDKARKDKKKRERQDKQDRQHWKQGQKGSTLATRVDATNTSRGYSSGSGDGKL